MMSPDVVHMKEEEKTSEIDLLDDLDINITTDVRSQDSFREDDSDKENAGTFATMQEKLYEILDNEDVEDVVDLNEKFLSQSLGVDQQDLALLPKIELRVDTRCHNLQVTGEILESLEMLKLNDSIIPSFRDIGTSFKNVRVLNIARCELTEVQGIQAFEQLEELYIGYNEVTELFDIGFLDRLSILDFEGNNVKDLDQLYYLKRCL